ncbi:MAG: response regulator [Bellilinea sp.]
MAEKILIVDDDLETLRLISMMLQKQGYQVVSAKNGVEGLALAASERPDMVVLDIMMPEPDGYQVAKQLRENPQTAPIPIMMFTAKSQLESKVAGYEAGADDYLTKPVHPTELIARIKALFTRSKTRGTGPLLTRRGYVVGVMAAKGGLGVSTLALNLALSYYQKTKAEVIAAEMRPGQGTWAGELGYVQDEGLTNLLSMLAGDITLEDVEKQLTSTTYGIRLLLATPKAADCNRLINSVAQLEVVLFHLFTLGSFFTLDIGTPYTPGLEKMLNMVDELILVTEPQPHSVKRTSQLIGELNTMGFSANKPYSVVINNRVRADMQLSAVQIQEILNLPKTPFIPGVSEQSYQAAMRNIPLGFLQPEGIYMQQINEIAAQYAARLRNEKYSSAGFNPARV